MQQLFRHQLGIVAAAAIVFFTNLGAAHLWDEDETWYATCAREMAQRGDWVVPTLNGELFAVKPPLMLWLMMSGYKLFGMTEFAARFWSAVFGVATALLTYHVGRLLFRATVGFWAGLIVASTLIFTVSARAATMDSALTFFTAAALAVFVLSGLRAGQPWTTGRPAPGQPSVALFSPGPWISFVLVYAFVGLAVLSKGPIGLLLPVATMGLFLLIANGESLRHKEAAARAIDPHAAATGGRMSALMRAAERGSRATLRLFAPRAVWRATWELRPWTALLVVGAVALPWYVLVGLRTDGAWLTRFLGYENLQRAFRPMESHSGPMIYYVPAILIGFFPWSVFLVPSLVAMVRRMRQQDAWKTALAFLSCWMGVWLVFWSIVSTKLPHYVLPICPALALMTAVFLDDWLREPARLGRGWLTNALVTVIVVGVGMIVALPILAHIFLPGEWALGLVGLILVGGGAICLWLRYRQEDRRALIVFAVMSVAFVTAIFGFAAVRVDRHQNAPWVLAQIRQSQPAPTQLVGYRYLKQSFVWCAGECIPRFDNLADLGRFLDSAENPCVITHGEGAAEIEREYPGAFRVLARQPRFLRSGEVVALARSGAPSPSHAAGREAGSRR